LPLATKRAIDYLPHARISARKIVDGPAPSLKPLYSAHYGAVIMRRRPSANAAPKNRAAASAPRRRQRRRFPREAALRGASRAVLGSEAAIAAESDRFLARLMKQGRVGASEIDDKIVVEIVLGYARISYSRKTCGFIEG